MQKTEIGTFLGGFEARPHRRLLSALYQPGTFSHIKQPIKNPILIVGTWFVHTLFQDLYHLKPKKTNGNSGFKPKCQTEVSVLTDVCQRLQRREVTENVHFCLRVRPAGGGVALQPSGASCRGPRMSSPR